MHGYLLLNACIYADICVYRCILACIWSRSTSAQDAYGPYIGTRIFLICSESSLHGVTGGCPLPIVVYLDNIAMYRDTQDQVLEDTLEAIKQPSAANFMLNLHKIQLV